MKIVMLALLTAIALTTAQGQTPEPQSPPPATAAIADLQRELDRAEAQPLPAGELRRVVASAAELMDRATDPGVKLAAGQVQLRAAYALAQSTGDPADAQSLRARAARVGRLDTPGAPAIAGFWAMMGRLLDLNTAPLGGGRIGWHRARLVQRELQQFLDAYAQDPATPAAMRHAVRRRLMRLADQLGDHATALAQATLLLETDPHDPAIDNVLRRAAAVGRPLGVTPPGGATVVLILSPDRLPDARTVAGVDGRLSAMAGEPSMAGIVYGSGVGDSLDGLPLATTHAPPGRSATLDLIASAGLPQVVVVDRENRVRAVGRSAAVLDRLADDPARPK